jgi:soluble lytic murein transglycosylase-like protein
VSVGDILRAEVIPDAAPEPERPDLGQSRPSPTTVLSVGELRQLLARAGSAHNIDADLLASLVQAESNGNAHAVSRAGAQGLMQLMPATASELNVHNSFAPDENIGGGTAYLDQLLTRYQDNIALALAAYNAGPAAVDRYHGIPPYAETRVYVARVIREFNRRKRVSTVAAVSAAAPAQVAAK